MLKSRNACFLTFLALLTAGIASPSIARGAESPDTIVVRGSSEKKIKCTVVSEGPKEVNYKDEKDKPQKMAWDQVARIEYKDFPSELGSAEASIERRAYDKALSSADEAVRNLGEGRFKDLFLTRACVAKAKALRCLSQYKEAAETAQKGIDAAGGNRWAVRAHIERVAALGAAGDDACASAVDAGAKACDDYPNDVAKDFRAEMALAAGQYFLNKGDTSKAKEQFGTAENSSKFLDQAKLGRARVKILEKDLAGAEEAFRTIAKTTQDPDALSGASLGLGDTALAKANRSTPVSGDDLREVLELYLRGAVLAQPTGGGVSDYHERTLRGAAQVCEQIAGTIKVPDDKKAKDWEKQASQKKFFVDYARKLYEDLVKTYPASKGVEDDKKKVGELRSKSVALSPPSAEAPK